MSPVYPARPAKIKSLVVAYYLKDQLRLFWKQPGKMCAELLPRDWIALAEESGSRILPKFAKTLQSHRAGLLTWYDFRISTGSLEGTNNKIILPAVFDDLFFLLLSRVAEHLIHARARYRTMRRQAYGDRDKKFFKLKRYALHKAKVAFVG